MTIKIDSYAVNAFSSRPLGGTIAGSSIALFSGGKHQGAVYFYGETVALPAPTVNNGIAIFHYPIQMLPVILDVLRNESPVNLNFISASNARLFTGLEPIGEAE